VHLRCGAGEVTFRRQRDEVLQLPQFHGSMVAIMTIGTIHWPDYWVA
jgi:hypothetical protein